MKRFDISTILPVWVLIILVVAGCAKGQYDQAISDFTKAIEINPKDARAYVYRGVVYGTKGQHDQAISDFTKAIEIDPRNALAYSGRGVAYHRKLQYDQAIADYNKAIEINPRYALAYKNRGDAYRRKGRYDQAISDFTKAIEINPKFAEAYYNRGTAYREEGEYNKAISDFTKAIEIDPEYAMAYNKFAWILATCPDAEYRNGVKAVELAQKAVELDPEDIWFWFDTLAAAYAEAGRFEDAITTQEKAIALLEKEGKTEEWAAEYVERLDSYKAHKPWRER